MDGSFGGIDLCSGGIDRGGWGVAFFSQQVNVSHSTVKGAPALWGSLTFFFFSLVVFFVGAVKTTRDIMYYNGKRYASPCASFNTEDPTFIDSICFPPFAASEVASSDDCESRILGPLLSIRSKFFFFFLFSAHLTLLKRMPGAPRNKKMSMTLYLLVGAWCCCLRLRVHAYFVLVVSNGIHTPNASLINNTSRFKYTLQRLHGTSMIGESRCGSDFE